MHEPVVDYSAAAVPVRGDLYQSHVAILAYLRQPGCWFTGHERLAVAAESRHALACSLCRARQASLSPEWPEGQHARASDLSQPCVEIVHRIRRDPQRLSYAWFDRVRTAGLDEGPYVELVGIVTLTAGLDYFCHALGIPCFALPAPMAGAPSRYRPENARGGTAWVAMLAPDDATGAEADLYEAASVPNIARALSLVPDHVRVLQRMSASHYVKPAEIGDLGVRRALDRLQMELVAARVSAMNECFY